MRRDTHMSCVHPFTPHTWFTRDEAYLQKVRQCRYHFSCLFPNPYGLLNMIMPRASMSTAAPSGHSFIT